MSNPHYPVNRAGATVESSVAAEPSGGYTALPNALLRVWIPALSGAETALLMWVIQDTLAWHREETKPTSYRLIAQRANVHRHSIESAVVALTGIGLIRVRDAGGDAEGCGQIFTIDSGLLQNPPMEFGALVQKLDQLRKRDRSKKRTAVVQKLDHPGPKIGLSLVQKLDMVGPKIGPPYKEEIKEKESKKLASESQELDQEIRDRIGRSRLIEIDGRPLDNRTVANIRAQIERLPDEPHAQEVLETLEDKCAELARYPERAKSWGLVVTVVTDAVSQTFRPPMKKDWFWMTTEERTAARAEAARSA